MKLAFSAVGVGKLDRTLDLLGNAYSAAFLCIRVVSLLKPAVAIVNSAARNGYLGKIVRRGKEAVFGIFAKEIAVSLVSCFKLLLQSVQLVKGIDHPYVAEAGIKLFKSKQLFLRFLFAHAYLVQLCFLCKDKLVVFIRCAESVLKILLLPDKVYNNAARVSLMQKGVHLFGDLIDRPAGVYLFGCGEQNVLYRLLYRALGYRGIANLTDKRRVFKQLLINAKEHLARRELAKGRRAAFKIYDSGILFVGYTARIFGLHGRARDKIALAANVDRHRTLCYAGVPVYSLFTLVYAASG